MTSVHDHILVDKIASDAKIATMMAGAHAWLGEGDSQSPAWPLTLLVSDAGAFRRQSVDTGALRARQAAFELLHHQPDVVHGGLWLGVQV